MQYESRQSFIGSSHSTDEKPVALFQYDNKSSPNRMPAAFLMSRSYALSLIFQVFAKDLVTKNKTDVLSVLFRTLKSSFGA